MKIRTRTSEQVSPGRQVSTAVAAKPSRCVLVLAGLLMASITSVGVSQELTFRSNSGEPASSNRPRANRPNTIRPRYAQLPRQTPSASSSASLDAAESLSQAFKTASNAILPSVVKIRTTTVTGGQTVRLRGLFPMEIPDQEQEGLGSGVIIDPSGIIMTNNHVVKDATEIIVELQDGTELHASEYTTDPMTDLAIVRVSAKRTMPAARLGDSDALSVGDWVLAVGHPLELETSVSAGIISAKGRSLKRIPRAQFLQTDAAINPGNSGGPLINLRGEVVGINTAIASQTGGYQGIGFAIPVNLAREVVRQLRDTGTVTRAYLGVNLQELTQDLAKQLADRPDMGGVLVNRVKKGTPAAQAGLSAGDVITHFANLPVDSPAALQRAVERVPIGSQQRLRLVRFGKPMETNVSTLRFDRKALGISEAQFTREFGSITRRLSIPVKDNSSLGFQIGNLKDEARKAGIIVEGNAVIVTRVSRGGLAAEEGIEPSMIIKQVRDRKVSNVDEFREALRGESLSDGILLLVMEPGEEESSERFVVLRSY